MRRAQIDYQLLIVIAGLLGLGTIMIFSASAPSSYSNFGDAYFFLKKQVVVLGLGIIAMFLSTFFDYRYYKKLAFPLLCFGFLLLIVVLTPAGKVVNNSRRWLDLGIFSFQPSEFMKIAMIFYVAKMLSKPNASLEKLKDLVVYMIIIVLTAVLLQLEPHLSSTIVIIGTVFVMLFIGGLKWKHILPFAGLGFAGVATLILMEPYRVKRVLAFLDPFNPESIRTGSWQIVNSLLAIGSGGIWGRGLGRSIQKYMYIPEPHNDFIFAVLAEELGFIGCFIVILMFAFLIYRGYTIAFHAADKFGSFIAAGLTSMIAIQVIINIAVVTSLMPVTGMSLPFFSYGGTSLVFLMFGMGVLLNISRSSDMN